MDVKKANEGKSKSDNGDIVNYAKRDKTFLKEQIDLISPNVIICGGTFHAFRNAVYDNIEDKNQLHYAWNTTSESSAWTHNNRLVINFYHPSYAFNKEDLFENLCSLLIEGKVFEKFNWD